VSVLPSVTVFERGAVGLSLARSGSGCQRLERQGLAGVLLLDATLWVLLRGHGKAGIVEAPRRRRLGSAGGKEQERRHE